MKKTNLRRHTRALLALAILGLAIGSANAQTELLAIEFNEDDQEGFELWPSTIAAAETTAEFTTDAAATSGTTTVTLTTSTGFGMPANRGVIVDGTPEGFTFSGMYQDLVHASSPTGVLTLDFSGLNANTAYRFTLYAWDPGATDASDKEWTVTEGNADPSVISVNFLDELVDNESFALVFDITTTATGTFQVTNTNGLAQSAINGFKLESLEEAAAFDITAIDYSPGDNMLTLTWDSIEGEKYAVRFSRDMTSWGSDLADDVDADVGESTIETFDLTLSGLTGATRVYFRVEKVPVN